MRTALALCLAALSLSLSACTVSAACTTEAIAGISLTVKDAVTGTLLCDATVQLTDQSGNKTLVTATGPASSCVYLGAIEQPGTYSMSVFEQGYSADIQQNLVVSSNGCHVNQLKVTSNLVH